LDIEDFAFDKEGYHSHSDPLLGLAVVAIAGILDMNINVGDF